MKQNPTLKTTNTKKECGCGSSGRVHTFHIGDPQFNSQYSKEKQKSFKEAT
jgi:hypothetical protein